MKTNRKSKTARLSAALAAAFALMLAACGDKPESAYVPGEDDDYPLAECVVSGEPLGSMGTPVEMVHEGVTVKLCCRNCIEEFESDPAKYTAMVEAAR